MAKGVYKRLSIEDRFWLKVKKTSHCWEWTAGRVGRGYGAMSIDNKQHPAHRVSWEIHNGKIPKGLFVLHKCDNRPCVNPKHLFLGTHTDNMRDRNKKGRGLAKLTESQVFLIRRLWKDYKTPQPQLAKRFGVARNTISSIVTRVTWSHV